MRMNYTGPIIIPVELMGLDLTPLEKMVAAAVFTLSDLGGLYSTDGQLANILHASQRGIWLSKKNLAEKGILRKVGAYTKFNFDAFSDPDALKAVLVETAAARTVKPILVQEDQ